MAWPKKLGLRNPFLASCFPPSDTMSFPEQCGSLTAGGSEQIIFCLAQDVGSAKSVPRVVIVSEVDGICRSADKDAGAPPPLSFLRFPCNAENFFPLQHAGSDCLSKRMLVRHPFPAHISDFRKCLVSSLLPKCRIRIRKSADKNAGAFFFLYIQSVIPWYVLLFTSASLFVGLVPAGGHIFT